MKSFCGSFLVTVFTLCFFRLTEGYLYKENLRLDIVRLTLGWLLSWLLVKWCFRKWNPNEEDESEATDYEHVVITLPGFFGIAFGVAFLYCLFRIEMIKEMIW